MTSGLRILALLAMIGQCFVQEARPMAVYAEGNDGPQGVHDSTTSLSNGLTATTAAAVTQKGLSTTTTVPIPVSGVFESRSDGSTSAQISAGRTTPPSNNRASGPPLNLPGGQSGTSNPNTTDIRHAAATGSWLDPRRTRPGQTGLQASWEVSQSAGLISSWIHLRR